MTTALPYRPRIVLYSELLSNIRQVSVAASLPSPADQSTKAEVCDDGSRLRVHHQGQIETLTLPTQVALSGSLALTSSTKSEMSWRLPVNTSASSTIHFSPENQAVPWTAQDLSDGTHVSCRNCSQNVVRQGAIKVWKDLPSENWAEMMDFWHCHRPHDHPSADQASTNGQGAGSKKGYSAGNMISAQPSVGLVDINSFMLSEEDCSHLLVSAKSPDSTA
jgi:hypothetical protein